jgi:hypothetical protein
MFTVQTFTPAIAQPHVANKQLAVLPQHPPTMPREEDEFISTASQVRSGAKNPLNVLLSTLAFVLPVAEGMVSQMEANAIVPVAKTVSSKISTQGTKIAQIRQAPPLFDHGPILKVPQGQVKALKSSLACEPVSTFSRNQVALVGRSMVVSPNGRSSAVLVPAGTYEASFDEKVDGTYDQLLNKCKRVLNNIKTQLSNGKIGTDINGTISLPTAVNDRQGFVSIGQGNLYLTPSKTKISWGGQPPQEVWKFTASNGENFVTSEPVKNQPNRQKPVGAPRG